MNNKINLLIQEGKTVAEIASAMDEMDSSVLYSHYSLCGALFGWVPEFKRPFNLILTFRYDVTENQVIRAYCDFINDLSEQLYNKAYVRYSKLVPEAGKFEKGGKGNKYHIHCLIDVPDFFIDQFSTAARHLWKHGRIEQLVEVDAPELSHCYWYNSKPKTTHTESGVITDSRIFVPHRSQ